MVMGCRLWLVVGFYKIPIDAGKKISINKNREKYLSVFLFIDILFRHCPNMYSFIVSTA